MALAESWQLKSRSHECSATGRAFEDGEEIFTALFPTDQGGFERRDFSNDGWRNRDPGEEPQPFSFWRSTYQPPVHEEKPEVVARESAEDLLRRLIEEDDEATENVRFILAVMLERRKLIRETDQQRTTGAILRIYEHRKTGEVLIVRDPDIPLAEVERIQQEVIAMLEGGREGAGEEPSAGDPESPEEPAVPEEPRQAPE